MGFIVTSAAKIPSEGFDYYIFLLYDGWMDDFRLEFEDNFENLAREVGTETLVIRGFDREKFSNEVISLYRLNIDSRSLPALLVTDIAPSNIDRITQNNKNINIIFIPLESIYKKPGSITKLLKFVAQTLKDKNAMESLKSRNPVEIEHRWGWLRYFEIKPNFYGFGVDLNQFFEEKIFKF
jgi:hypothetical protein